MKPVFWVIVLTVFFSSVFGFGAGLISSGFFYEVAKEQFSAPVVNNSLSSEYLPQTSQEEVIIKVVKENSPAVVSIIITKDLPILEQYFFGPFSVPFQRQKGTEKQEVGGGSGFIVSQDGLVLTNKHVTSFGKDADYTVLTNDGRKFPAKVLAQDPSQDLAILKIEQEKKIDEQGNFESDLFPIVKLGDSDNLQIGQTVVAIGNSLGEFRNTVSTGVVSGLGRTITASGGGIEETLENVIQTDAAINKGNSGGPLLNLKGEVVGINTATVLDAQSIGFAIPVNRAKKDIEQVKILGKIVIPFLGVRYVLREEGGALVERGNQGEAAVTPGSAAGKAGIRDKDIILEFNGEKITQENSLSKIIMKYNPGDKVSLKILRGEKEIILEAVLDEKTE